jgi:type IV secretory pathway TrbF-like protein
MTTTEQVEAMDAAKAEKPWAEEWRASYHAARQEWLERYGNYIAAAQSWRRVALLALTTAALAIAALIWMGAQKEIVPYVVQVDKLGGVAAVERADRMSRPEEPLITAALARWIAAVRTVYADAAAQKSLVTEAYAMINRLGEAYGVLNEHMRAQDPFSRARTETVAVDVRSVLPIAGDSWRIEWREETRSRDGSRLASTDYQATVTLSFSPPRDEATIRANPLGLYVSALHWAQRL